MLLDQDYQRKETELELTDKEVFTEIWVFPKRVFTFISQKNYLKYMMLLLFLSGVSRAFNQSMSQSYGDSTSFIVILIINILVGGFIGWIFYYIYGGLLSWTGKWLKGQSDTNAMIRTVAYANIPIIVVLVLITIELFLFQNEAFKSNYGWGISGPEVYLIRSLFYIRLLLSIWSYVLLVIGISVVQKFNYFKAFLNSILPLLIFLVPIFVFALAINFLF